MDQNQELCGRYLVSLLSSVLQKNQPDEKPEELTFESLFEMAEAHQVSVMALAAVEQLTKKPEPALLASWLDVAGLYCIINVSQILELERLKKSFSSEGIRAVPLKGCLMKFLYPCTEYRQMGDLDILIEKKDAKKAQTMMETLGYQTQYFEATHHDSYIRNKFLHVELHRSLINSQSGFFAYFKDIWTRVQPDESANGEFRLSREDFYLFLTAHFEKHFHNCGSGLRSIMDFSVYLDAYGDTLDWAYIDRELTKLGLDEFHKTVRQLAMAWFHDDPISDTARQMERELFDSGGVYGSRQKYLDNTEFRLRNTTKLKYLKRMVFLPFRQLRIIYPLLHDWPVLYPFFLMHRLIKKWRVGMEEMRYIKKRLK